MEAHFFVIIDSRGKCRLCTIPLNAENDGITSGLPQGLAQGTLNHISGDPLAPIRAQKQPKIPPSKPHFHYFGYGRLISYCGGLTNYLFPFFLAILSHPSLMTLHHIFGDPVVPIRAQRWN